ncbi:Hypothetical predicted protein [Paramuricea clavata]|uniref:Uncharacterized protein n=1 Tax=Paramuricea clavata TaxID=317549 RepID=A0A6S7FZZ3_PARCT|nr:Hypothetical predicted protein [Paramuricea clavata]
MLLPRSPPNINPITFFISASYLGIFKKDIKIENPKREIVAVEEVGFCKDESGNKVLGSFQFAKVERTGQVNLISPENDKHVLSMIAPQEAAILIRVKQL